MKKRALSAFISLSLLLLWSPFTFLANGQEKKEVLVVVGNVAVDKEEFLQLLSKENEGTVAPLTRREFEENFDLFLNYKLKVIEAEAINLDKSEEFSLEFSSIKESLVAPFLIKNSIEEGEVKKVYSRMQEIVHASHILFQFPTNASHEDSLSILRLALKVKANLENGADFKEQALTYSDDPSAKVNQGDLGFFTSLQMVQQFEEAAYMLQVGQISDPILTDFGYHIIQVNGRQANPGEVQVSHILVRFDAENNDQEEAARRKISDTYLEIQKENTVWEDIVKTYSEDASTRNTGGILPWFGVGTMIPEFERASFSLTEIGEVSPPIKTPYGYHILRLEGKRELQPFQELEQIIRSKLLRNSKSVVIESQVVSIQKSRFAYKENEAEITRLANLLVAKDLVTFQTQIQENGLSKTKLFSIYDKAYFLEDLLAYIQDRQVTPKGSGSYFNRWLTNFVAKTLEQTEIKDLENNNIAYKKLVKEYRDGTLMFSLTNQEVWQKGLNDSIGQQEFYKKNIRNYQWKSRVQAYLVKVNDASKLDRVRNYLENKTFNPDEFAAFEADYRANFPTAYAIESGVFEYEIHPILSRVDLNKPYQELTIDGTTYVLIVGKTYPPGPRKFEEARGLVIRDYQDYLDQALTKRLKEKYPIQINNGVKERTFAALNQ